MPVRRLAQRRLVSRYTGGLSGRAAVVAYALVASVVAASCGGRDGPAAPSPQTFTPLPGFFHVVGEAEAEDALARRAECQIHLVWTLKGRPRIAGDTVSYDADYGGHTARAVFDRDGDGFGFFADVFGPGTVVRLLPGDSIELVVSDTPDPNYRFWRELALIGGRRTDDGLAAGRWTCAPFDIWENGYVDTAVVAVGTWRMQLQQPGIGSTRPTLASHRETAGAGRP